MIKGKLCLKHDAYGSIWTNIRFRLSRDTGIKTEIAKSRLHRLRGENGFLEEEVREMVKLVVDKLNI